MTPDTHASSSVFTTQQGKTLGWLLLIASFAVVSVILLLQWGAVDIAVNDVWQCVFGRCVTPMQEAVIWQIRLPRILLGFLVGAGLACCGAVMQTAVRNPLADPYLFGIVAGAGLGIVIANQLLPLLSVNLLPLMAFIGAAGAILLVIALAYYLQRVEVIVLAGVSVAFLLGAATQLLLYLGEPMASNRIMFWLMGSLAGANMAQVQGLAAVFLVALTASLAMHRQLNVLLLDDDSARALGVHASRLRILLLLGCAVLTAMIVAYAGGIGFVGLMVPHMVRFLTGSFLLALLLGCTLVGGVLMIWVDFLARNLLSGQDIPIGILTSALGSLFFMGLLFRAHQRA